MTFSRCYELNGIIRKNPQMPIQRFSVTCPFGFIVFVKAPFFLYVWQILPLFPAFFFFFCLICWQKFLKKKSILSYQLKAKIRNFINRNFGKSHDITRDWKCLASTKIWSYLECFSMGRHGNKCGQLKLSQSKMHRNWEGLVKFCVSTHH